MTSTDTMTWVYDRVKESPLFDSHEHLVEESRRLKPRNDWLLPCDDWPLLFKEYVQDDLHCAGMGSDEEQRFYEPGTTATTKFKIVSPYWERIQHTGYAQALITTFRELYGVSAFSLETIDEVAAKYEETRKPGFYRHIIKDVCNISQCQVNSMERIFMETESPTLLGQDLSIMELSRCSLGDVRQVEEELGVEVKCLGDWLAAIDSYFERFGRTAVAIKYVGAYYRALDFAHVDLHVAERHFAAVIAPRSFIGHEGARELEDFLFHYCLRKAQDFHLPVKIHTGYYATKDSMPLSRVRENANDVCRLLQSYPRIRFILMHLGYPYQDEYIALCKQYSNAYLDMCWTWIINSVASVRFLLEVLVTAPIHKILTFGGDYYLVENIVGHSMIARRGIAEALSTLVDRCWIDRGAVPDLISRLMQSNGERLFQKPRIS